MDKQFMRLCGYRAIKWFRKLIIVFTLINTLLFSWAIKAEDTPKNSFWEFMKGSTPPNSLYVGMWTFHLDAASRDDNANNQLVAILYKSFFAGTFLNSYSVRSYAAGIQRNLYVHPFGESGFKYSLGYRAGLIEGYDHRLSAIAGELPVIPFASLLADFQYKHLGVEFSYTGYVTSVEFHYNF